MSTFSEDFMAANKLTAYVVRYLNGQATVKVSTGTGFAEASSSAGEADAARKALALLTAPSAIEVEPEPEDAPVEPEAPSFDESFRLHPAGSDLPPPPFHQS